MAGARVAAKTDNTGTGEPLANSPKKTRRGRKPTALSASELLEILQQDLRNLREHTAVHVTNREAHACTVVILAGVGHCETCKALFWYAGDGKCPVCGGDTGNDTGTAGA